MCEGGFWASRWVVWELRWAVIEDLQGEVKLAIVCVCVACDGLVLSWMDGVGALELPRSLVLERGIYLG